MKYIAPSEKVVKQLPSEQVLKNYGRSSNLLIAEKDMPDLHFDVAETKEKGQPSEREDVMEIMNLDTKESMQNSNSWEHSKNSQQNAAGEAQEQVSEQRSVKQALDPELHSNVSEYREHSQKSRSSGKSTDVETSGNIVHQMLERRVHPGDSENREHSQNWQEKQAVEEMEHVNVTMSVRENQCSLGDSDF